MTVINITPILARAVQDAAAWTRHEFLNLCQLLAASIPGTEVDWDSGVPENWARILHGTDTLAIVCVLCPLLVIRDDVLPSCVALPAGIQVLRVSSMREETYCVGIDVVEKLVNREVSCIAWDPARFCIDDLYVVTVT